eukprot:scaffold12848_cov140-Isochrysis_galbana.AAC.2
MIRRRTSGRPQARVGDHSAPRGSAAGTSVHQDPGRPRTSVQKPTATDCPSSAAGSRTGRWPGRARLALKCPIQSLKTLLAVVTQRSDTAQQPACQPIHD